MAPDGKPEDAIERAMAAVEPKQPKLPEENLTFVSQLSRDQGRSIFLSIPPDYTPDDLYAIFEMLLNMGRVTEELRRQAAHSGLVVPQKPKLLRMQ